MSDPKQVRLPVKSDWRKQIVGVFAGGVAGFMLGSLFPGLVVRFGMPALIIWCGVIGGVFNSSAGFMRAGALITHSQNRWLNLIVGIGLPAVIIALLSILLNMLPR